MDSLETKATKLMRRYFQAVNECHIDEAVKCFNENYRVVLKKGAYGPNEPAHDEILSRGLDQIKAEHIEAFRQTDKETRFVDVFKSEYHTDGTTSVFVRYTAGNDKFEVTYICSKELDVFTERIVHKIEMASTVETSTSQRKKSVY